MHKACGSLKSFNTTHLKDLYSSDLGQLHSLCPVLLTSRRVSHIGSGHINEVWFCLDYLQGKESSSQSPLAKMVFMQHAVGTLSLLIISSLLLGNCGKSKKQVGNHVHLPCLPERFQTDLSAPTSDQKSRPSSVVVWECSPSFLVNLIVTEIHPGWQKWCQKGSQSNADSCSP